METSSTAQQIFDKEELYSAFEGRNKPYQQLLAMGYHWFGITKFAKVATLPSALQAYTHTPYEHSRRERPIDFYTRGLDLIGPIHAPLNKYIRVFAATK